VLVVVLGVEVVVVTVLAVVTVFVRGGEVTVVAVVVVLVGCATVVVLPTLKDGVDVVDELFDELLLASSRTTTTTAATATAIPPAIAQPRPPPPRAGPYRPVSGCSPGGTGPRRVQPADRRGEDPSSQTRQQRWRTPRVARGLGKRKHPEHWRWPAPPSSRLRSRLPITRRQAPVRDRWCAVGAGLPHAGLWAAPVRPVSYGGRHLAVDDLVLSPAPARAGVPPIWLVGAGARAERRVGRPADGRLP
jgi:hypothetical protein